MLNYGDLDSVYFNIFIIFLLFSHFIFTILLVTSLYS